MSHKAFLSAIRAAPDADGPRLIYADWLDEHGGPAGAARAEFIRVQCALAPLAWEDPRRPPLAEREKALLNAHYIEWTDLTFADWLGHRKRDCRNPKGHDFCKLVAQGIRARVERDRLPEGDPRRKKSDKKLERLGWRMQDDYGYLPATCDCPLYLEGDGATFRRGFVESVNVHDFAVVLFAEALSALEVLRDIAIENDSSGELGDAALTRLVSVLGGLRLRDFDSAASIDDLNTVKGFAAAPALRGLETLSLWFECGDTGDEAIEVLAASPYLAGLWHLEVEHTLTFTDRAFLAILDSPTLKGLTRCRLRPNEAMPLSKSVRRRFEERFGPIVSEMPASLPAQTTPAS